MRMVFVALLIAHGLIHLMGAAKAFRWAELPQLTQPISPVFGTLWLIAALLFLATAASFVIWPRGWWAIGGCAVLLSTLLIVPSWTDAKFGALANVVVGVGVVFGFLSQGPTSLRAEYDRDVERHVLAGATPPVVTDADLAALPPPVQRYLRMAGVIGQPRVRNFHVRLRGRIRDSRDGRWMPFSSEQYNVLDPPARLFYLNASMLGVPVQGYHRYVGNAASMRVKAAALVPAGTSSGVEMTQSETVTFFNDMCLMAPATLIDPAIEWQPADDPDVARASFSAAGHTIHAELRFSRDDGTLTDFISDDRYQAEADGSSMVKRRWSTPVSAYRAFGAVRLPSFGEGRWHDSEGDYPYIELNIEDVRYNVGPS